MKLDKEEWIARCAQRYLTQSEITEDEAYEFANAQWDYRDDYNTPEDAADEDMSYWEG